MKTISNERIERIQDRISMANSIKKTCMKYEARVKAMNDKGLEPNKDDVFYLKSYMKSAKEYDREAREMLKRFFKSIDLDFGTDDRLEVLDTIFMGYLKYGKF